MKKASKMFDQHPPYKFAKLYPDFDANPKKNWAKIKTIPRPIFKTTTTNQTKTTIKVKLKHNSGLNGFLLTCFNRFCFFFSINLDGLKGFWPGTKFWGFLEIKTKQKTSMFAVYLSNQCQNMNEWALGTTVLLLF